MEVRDVLSRGQILVKELSEGLISEGMNRGNCTFEQVEKRILQFVNELGQALEQEVQSE